MQAAVQLFSQNGFRGTTTKQLAHAVGVSEPVLYMHFATKRELYNAIIGSLTLGADGLKSAILPCPADTDDRCFFRRLADLMLGWHMEDPARIRILLFSALEGHELSEIFYQKQIVPFNEAFTSYIKSRIDEGAFRDINPLQAARAFCGMVGQYAQSMVIFGLIETAEQQAAALDGIVDLFLNGVRKNA